ncbi:MULTISPECIES: hypothetical protein [unclassified Novosphingobium]|uniref:hypothetical protein n=1 Tax=unclassified Novosphingobium TaxID=2644732 RepID=UPI001358C877|nr:MULTISPECIES: hypothetical protein [unclassified Novosphingobium]
MFSMISLYFAYRRDVVLAERYVAGLAEAPAATAAQTPAEMAVSDQAAPEKIKLAA